MGRRVDGKVEVKAELKAPTALVQLVRYHFHEPPDSSFRVDGKLRVELCLMARHPSARACFCDHWNTHRFERIGDLFVTPPNSTMLVRSDEVDSLTSVVCELDLEPVMELFDKPPRVHDRWLMASLDVRNTELRTLLLRLAREARRPGFASEILVESIAGQMAVEMFRHGTAIAQGLVYGGLAPWQLRAIDERLSEAREAPTLRVLAELCRISVRQLTRGFRTSRGCSIGAYVINRQMEHAKTLLATDESVASVAKALGFSSSANFCFAFRRAMGITPGQFRQTLLRR
jgi:AraC family transcriptional regulator